MAGLAAAANQLGRGLLGWIEERDKDGWMKQHVCESPPRRPRRLPSRVFLMGRPIRCGIPVTTAQCAMSRGRDESVREIRRSIICFWGWCRALCCVNRSLDASQLHHLWPWLDSSDACCDIFVFIGIHFVFSLEDLKQNLFAAGPCGWRWLFPLETRRAGWPSLHISGYKSVPSHNQERIQW
jgi:hypothetical protein